MSDSIEFELMLLKYFTVNKQFACCNTVYFTLDLHFYGDMHLTNWGRFNTYDSAVRFATDMFRTRISDPRLLEYLPRNPKERGERRMLRGIDISYWNRDIDLSRVIELNDLDFCIMKATESVNDVDSYCDSFYQIAKRKNVKRGVYHLLTSAARGSTQADYFLRHIEGYVHDSMLILDIEGTSSYYTRDVSTAREFCERVISKTGVKPVVYMNMATLDAEDWKPVVDLGCDLWIANYWFGSKRVDWTDMDPSTHMASPDEFPYAALWQFTETGKVKGYDGNLDLDLAFMTRNAWDLYANPEGGAHEDANGEGETETGSDATGTGSDLIGKTVTVRIESIR